MARILRECAPDPRHDRRFAIIADVGNPDYYLRRAQEQIVLAQADEGGNVETAVALLSLYLQGVQNE